MSIGDGAQGSGNGQVRYEARPNSGAARTGTLTIAGQTVVIRQGDGCSYDAATSVRRHRPDWRNGTSGGEHVSGLHLDRDVRGAVGRALCRERDRSRRLYIQRRRECDGRSGENWQHYAGGPDVHSRSSARAAVHLHSDR